MQERRAAASASSMRQHRSAAARSRPRSPRPRRSPSRHRWPRPPRPARRRSAPCRARASISSLTMPPAARSGEIGAGDDRLARRASRARRRAGSRRCARARAGWSASRRAACRAGERRRRSARGPVALSAASRRGGLAADRGGVRLDSCRGPGETIGRFDDLHVARAAAQVARERRADRVARRMRVAREQRGQRHDEARRAESALDRARIDQAPAARARRSRRRRRLRSVVTRARRRRRRASGRSAPSVPSSSTVQAPQTPWLQPRLVPVSSSVLAQHVEQRRARRGASTSRASPLTISVRVHACARVMRARSSRGARRRDG